MKIRRGFISNSSSSSFVIFSKSNNVRLLSDVVNDNKEDVEKILKKQYYNSTNLSFDDFIKFVKRNNDFEILEEGTECEFSNDGSDNIIDDVMLSLLGSKKSSNKFNWYHKSYNG